MRRDKSETSAPPISRGVRESPAQRVTQIMDLLNLAPVVQEALLDSTRQGKSERSLRRVVGPATWSEKNVIDEADAMGL